MAAIPAVDCHEHESHLSLKKKGGVILEQPLLLLLEVKWVLYVAK